MVSHGLWLHMSKLRHAWTNCVDTKSASVNAIACEFQKLACPQTFDCRYRRCVSSWKIYLPCHSKWTTGLFPDKNLT